MSQPLRVTESPLDRVTPPSPSTRATGPVVGIDLGTSFCRVGVMREGQALVATEGGRPAAIPAYVGLSPQGRVLVGQPAQRQLASAPERTVFGIKRLLAPYRSPAAKSLRRQLRCPLYAGPDGQTWVRLGERAFAPWQLLAMLLCQARDVAQNFLGQPVYRAVVAVPPGWDEARLGSLREAVTAAGLHVAGALAEPLAITFAQKRDDDAPARHLLTCDFGGGGFRASLVESSDAGYRLAASRSDDALGGLELDRALLEHLLAEVPERTWLLSDENAASASRVSDAVERAKQALSERREARVRVPFVLPSTEGALRDLDLPLPRALLDTLATPFVDGALALCRQVLEEARLHPAGVDEVLLAGGQSRMPLLRRRLGELFPRTPVRAEAPEEAVAVGAVLAGAGL